MGMSPAGDSGCHSVSVTRHHASRQSSRASPVDELIYATGCASDEVRGILAVQHNERETSYFMTETAFSTMIWSGSEVSLRSGKTKCRGEDRRTC